MGLDIRLPIGMMFSLLGILLAAYGLATNSDAMYQASLGININLVWGGVLFLFGAVMFLFAIKSAKKKE
jgi:predicted membrane channel-forming protein YqfA (hemolysin III family)